LNTRNFVTTFEIFIRKRVRLDGAVRGTQTKSQYDLFQCICLVGRQDLLVTTAQAGSTNTVSMTGLIENHATDGRPVPAVSLVIVRHPSRCTFTFAHFFRCHSKENAINIEVFQLASGSSECSGRSRDGDYPLRWTAEISPLNQSCYRNDDQKPAEPD